jgi:hypothetical protein
MVEARERGTEGRMGWRTHCLYPSLVALRSGSLRLPGGMVAAIMQTA